MKIPRLRLAALVFCIPAIFSSLSAAPPKIGVLLKGRSDFWSAMEKGALEAGAKLGADVIVKAPLSEADIAVQIQLLGAMGAQGIQALVIAPCNRDTLAGPVAALAARGVKVVVVDSPLAGADTAPFVGTNQLAAGEAAGRLLAGLVQENDEVSILRFSQTSVAAQQRETGAMGALRAAHPHLVVHDDIYSSSESGVEAERCVLLLDKYPATRAILASSTQGTMAMLKLLEARKSAGSITFVGFGFNLNPAVAAALSDGTMRGWVAQLPRDVGYKGVETALALLAGQKVNAPVSTDIVVITKDNLADPRVQALLAN